MIARVAAMDTPTTQIAATKISSPAGRPRPGGPGTTVPTATGSRLGTAATGPAVASPSLDGAVPPAGAGAAGSPEAATPGTAPALEVALASGDLPAARRSDGDPAAVGDPGSAAVTLTVTDPTSPRPPTRHPGSIVTLTRPCRSRTATWLLVGTTPRSAPLIIRCADWPRWFTKVTVPPARTVTDPVSGCDDAPTPSSPQPPLNATVEVAANAVPGKSSAAPAQAAARAGASRCRRIR